MVHSSHVPAEVFAVAAIVLADVAYHWDRCLEVEPQVGFQVNIVGRLLSA